jgi:single stranded DNA-binding protein
VSLACARPQFQVIHLVARIATTPRLEVHGDTKLATLRVAVQRPKRNGEEQAADFFDVTAFGAQAENAVRYLDTGRRVAVTGRLRQQTWQQDGQSRQRVDIVADPYGIQFLDRPRTDDDGWQAVAEPDDIPF